MTYLPENFCLEHTLELLKNPKNVKLLKTCFVWNTTPQGQDYWWDIFDETQELSESDLTQLQDWVNLYRLCH